jgi:hypothetical protein
MKERHERDGVVFYAVCNCGETSVRVSHGTFSRTGSSGQPNASVINGISCVKPKTVTCERCGEAWVAQKDSGIVPLKPMDGEDVPQ